jgi:hypothetical protein
MTSLAKTISRSSVTRRNLLTSATATAATILPGLPSIAAVRGAPVERLWQEWQRLHARAAGLCHRWQDIETHLMRTIGVPQVQIPSPDNSASLRALSHAEIDRALTKLPSSPEIAAALHDDLANQRAHWDAEATRLGFDEIKRQEDGAWNQEAEASAAIFRARATSLAGIEIKIALIVEFCSTGSDDPEFPWPQLRSTLADLKRLRRKLGAVQR